MKQTILLSLFLIPFYLSSFSQAGEWTWMKGNSGINTSGNFGTLGIPAASNDPPAVYGASKWKDAVGNFWIFGGLGAGFSFYNALWKYDPLTNMWTWIKGPSTTGDAGSYGTMGVSSPSNNPGSRAFGSACWIDLNGDLWLYGGNGNAPFFSGMLADLWKYNIATNEWTWMAGQPGDLSNFGTLGLASPANTPGGREECTANWVDAAGNLWFYGGLRDGFGGTDGNDMWMFNSSTNLWTWMSGSNQVLLPPVYGTQNVYAPANTPGGRMNYSGWKDDDGIFWMFGGENDGNSNNYSDLWKYDATINQWAWVSGSSFANNNGNAGVSCDTSSLFYPRSRFENRAAWVDNCGNFWLFGGYFNGDLNDLWVYQPINSTWSFVGGSLSLNQSGNYGTQGVSSPSNVPGGRMGAVSFYGNDNTLWFFGGTTNYVGNFLNDLWRFIPDPSCPALISCTSVPPTPGINVSDTSLCEKFCIDFFDLSTNDPFAWQWTFPGGSPLTSPDQNPVQVCYSNPGIYDVTLIATNAFGSDTLTLNDFITVYSTPPLPVISQNGYMLTSTSAAAYQWQFNTVNIPGATNQSYEATQTGLYTVVITDENGCSASAIQYVVITGLEETFTDANIAVYPNPSEGNFIVEWMNGLMTGDLSIQVVNTLGQVIFSSEEKITASNFKKEIELSNASRGIYFIEIKTKDVFVRKKLTVVN